jgi:hypothetical protein
VGQIHSSKVQVIDVQQSFTVLALLSSAGLFAGYMWIYISPLIKDKNAVAPYSTTIPVSEGGFQENRRRAGASRPDLVISTSTSPATTRSTLNEPPLSDESSSHEDTKSTMGRPAPQYVHTYGRDFLDPGFHTRPLNTSLKTPRGVVSPSAITPPPPAYISQPSTPTPDYGFTDGYSDRSFGSPTPSSNDGYPYRPSVSDHSSPSSDSSTRTGPGSLSARSSPSYPSIGLGRPSSRSGSSQSCSSNRTFSQGNSDYSLYATSQTEHGSSNGGHSVVGVGAAAAVGYLSSGHTSPSSTSFSIPSYYHHHHRRHHSSNGSNNVRSIPNGTLAPGYPLPAIPTPKPQQPGVYHQPMHAQVFQSSTSAASSTTTLVVPPPLAPPRPLHMQRPEADKVTIYSTPRRPGPGRAVVAHRPVPPLRQLDMSIVPSFPPGYGRPGETRF